MASRSKRRTILTESEIAELYSPPQFSPEQQRFYFTLNDIELSELDELNDRCSKIYFVMLLGFFKFKPIVLNFNAEEVQSDFQFIADEYFKNKTVDKRHLGRSQKTRLYQRVLKLRNHILFNNAQHRDELQKFAQRAAVINLDPRSILDEMISHLSTNEISIPKYTVLQTITTAAVKQTNMALFDVINRHISLPLKQFLLELCSDDSDFKLKHIRRSAKDFTINEISKELTARSHIAKYIDEIDGLVKRLGLSPYNIGYYSSLVDFYTITKLKRFDKNTQAIYLICYLHERYKTICEHVADAFDYHCRRLKESAVQYAKDQAYTEWNTASKNIGKASQLLRLFIDETVNDCQSFGEVKQHALTLLDAAEIDSVCLFLADEKRTPEHYHWRYYDQQKALIGKTLRPLFLALEFKASSSTRLLYQQIKQTQRDLKDHSRCDRMDRRLIKPKLVPYIITDDEINAHRYEVLLYLLIKSKINGHLFIQKTTKYSALNDDLVDDNRWKNKGKMIDDSKVERIQIEPKVLLGDLEHELESKLNNVSERIRNGDNQSVIMQDRTGKKGWRLPNKRVGSLLNNPFFERIKQIHIVELLRLVDRETGYLNAFEHVRIPQDHDESTRNNLVATLIGNGTNYGLHRMAHISDRSYDDLRLVQANYVRLETLNIANDIITNAIAKLPIFRYYDIQPDEMHASIDGQKFECRLTTFKTRYSSKYFGTNKGVSAVSLVANHVPINAQVIGANEHESHFVFDLLYNNTSDIKPTVLSTDTHGANQVNFALLDLFGYTFAPRYANVGKVIDGLFRLSNTESKPLLALKKPIKGGYILQEWDTIQRIIVSLQQKTMSQSTLIRKLSSYSASHPLVKALAEYDRMIKSMYLLDYIDDATLRGYVQRALNRGEAYHQLRRAIASVNGNRFRGGDDQEIELWNECARLLANAVIYFNSLVLSNLLYYFGSTNDTVKQELVKSVSPVAWVNVNLNGTYSFSFDENAITIESIISPITSE